MGEASLQSPTEAPPDKYNLVYIIFLVHGIAILLPWNMFINAISYFTQYKLGHKYIGSEFPYIGNFMQYLTFSSQIPSVLFNWLNIYVPLKGDLTLRIVWSLVTNIIVFVVTVFLAMIDTSGWPYAFFYITMISVVVLNMATGVYQNTIFGMVAKLPPRYTAAIILGNNICGTFTTVVAIISHYVTNSDKMAGIYYFITAIFMLLVGFDTFYALPLNKYYRHFDLKAKKQQEQQRKISEGNMARPPYIYVIKKTFPQMCNVGFIFIVTLATFPAMQAGIIRSNPNFFIQDDFLYQQILCFLTFNVFAMIGSMLPSFIIWPSKEKLVIPVTLRFIYIPLYLICNYHPFGVTRTLPVLIKNDYIYWIVGATMAITSGYFSSLAMMFAPSCVEDQYAYVAGMFASASLITGIFIGIVTSFLWPWLVSIAA